MPLDFDVSRVMYFPEFPNTRLEGDVVVVGVLGW
jgi:hypothetical protein